ncbi:hypothetical protein CSX04_05479 [Burkholderia cepacia]|nr:hypothetical protein CSX04_05479 [Burkholderia cepacia]
MVMFVGGMFGVMRRTGVVDAGIDRLLQLTGNNAYLLTPLLMILIGLGSTLLGFISEYLVIIPMVVVIARRLGLSDLFAVALVAIARRSAISHRSRTRSRSPLPSRSSACRCSAASRCARPYLSHS